MLVIMRQGQPLQFIVFGYVWERSHTGYVQFNCYRFNLVIRLSLIFVLKHSHVGIFLMSGGRLFQRVEPPKVTLFLYISLIGKGMLSTGPSYSLVLPLIGSR